MSRFTGPKTENEKSESSTTVDTTKFLLKSGGTLSGRLDMGTNKITNLAACTANTDATNKKYVDDQNDLKLDLAGGALTGPLGLSGGRIWDLGPPTLPHTATNKKYVDHQDALSVLKAGSTMSGELNMGSNKITSLETPTSDSDARTKKYVDDELSKPNVINTAYTLSSLTDTITVSSSSITTAANDALTVSDLIEPKKIVKLNLSQHQLFGASFFLNGNELSLFGQLDNLSGYVHSAEITIVQPTAWTASATLTSVQMMMSNETDPTTMNSNLTNKLTRRLAPGTYSLTPVKTQFTGLRYLGFFWKGGDAINQIEFSAKIILWITV